VDKGVFLPITSAIIDGQTIRVADEKYIIPLIAIIETLEIKAIDIKRVSGQGELYKLADEYLPIIRLYSVFNFTPKITDKITDPEEGVLVIVEDEGQKVGLFIDALLGQQHVVIKRLETNYRKVIGVSGVTILGDGSVALIIDVPGVIGLYRDPSLAKMPLHNDRVA
jgi:two-component system chemotaxis sensor kinase CheA